VVVLSALRRRSGLLPAARWRREGFADVVLDGCVEIKSEYGRNTPIVTAVMRDGRAAVRVTDFAPRFYPFGRPDLLKSFALSAHRWPAARHDPNSPDAPLWAANPAAMGSNHQIQRQPTALRVTTDAPLSYVDREAAFVLTHPLHGARSGHADRRRSGDRLS
jgi:hypothetical protein